MVAGYYHIPFARLLNWTPEQPKRIEKIVFLINIMFCFVLAGLLKHIDDIHK